MTTHDLYYLTVWRCITSPLEVIAAVRLLYAEHKACTSTLAEYRTELAVLREERANP